MSLPWSVIALPLALSVACTDPVSTPGVPHEAPDKALVVAVESDVGTLNQHFARSSLDAFVSEPLSDPLFSTGFADGRLSYAPGQLEAWSFDGDGRSVLLTLRGDGRWSDGQPVTAHDLAFTIELARDPRVGSVFAPDLEFLAEEGAVEVLDDTSLRLGFARPVMPEAFLAHFSGLVVLPRHLLAEVEHSALQEHGFNRAPVLNGPFSLVSWEADSQIRLAPTPGWRGPESSGPQLDDVVFRVIPEYATRLVELEAGRVDLVADLRVHDAQRLVQEHPEVTLHRRGPRSMVYVGWNQRGPADPEGLRSPHPLFAELAVRRALAQAVDVDRVIQDLFRAPEGSEPYAQRAVSTVTPALVDAHAHDIQPLEHDPEAARAALAELGWRDSDGDGVLDRDGHPFRFELMTRSSTKPRAQAAVHLQADLRAIGVRVDITTLERAAYFERLFAGDFDAVLGGWASALYVELGDTWHSGPEAHYNFVGYGNAGVDTLIEEGLAAQTLDQANQAWREAQRRIYADQPYLFLYWADEIVAVHGRFEEVRVDLAAPWRDLHRWRVAPTAD